MSTSVLEHSDSSRSLAIEIPTDTNSPYSSVTPSPTGILDSTTAQATNARESVSCTSLQSAPNMTVTFAPLPKMGPRKRRSAAPLGMAGRQQLMRRRKSFFDERPEYTHSPMWTQEEMEAYHMREANGGSGDEEIEDPFLAIGRMMKGAGKHIWRKVSNKNINKDAEKDKQNDTQGNRRSKDSGAGATKNPVLVTGMTNNRPMTSVIAPNDSGQEEGRVWEEEIGEGLPPNIGQTQTIVEGRTKYKMTEVDNAPPATPSSHTKIPVLKTAS